MTWGSRNEQDKRFWLGLEQGNIMLYIPATSVFYTVEAFTKLPKMVMMVIWHQTLYHVKTEKTQESPPTWTQEAYLRKRRIKYYICCPVPGVGGTPAGGYPTLGTTPIGPGQRIPHYCWDWYPTLGTPIRPGWEVPHPCWGYPTSGTPQLGYPPAGPGWGNSLAGPGWGTPSCQV